MITEHKALIFLVDDDPLFLKSLELEFLEQTMFIIRTFLSGELCLTHLTEKPDVIILDYRLDAIDKNAMNGLETLDKIRAAAPNIPVIMLSAQDKIEIAINCMHHHAFDYVVKSETAFVRLQKIIATIFRNKRMENQLNWYMDRM